MQPAKSKPSPHQFNSSANETGIVYCVAFAAFTFQFEAFLVNVSLPDMAREMHTTSTAISFVIITYLLAASMSFLPAGRLGDRYGLRRVFLFGCVLACLGTLASGLSVNLMMLWISRFVQGLGSGVMVAIGYAMIPIWVAKERMGWGYGMLSLGAGLGMVAGLPIGGLLSYYFEWHWLFLTTFPVFMLLIWLARKNLPVEQSAKTPATPQPDIDWVGLFISALAIAAFVLSISLGGELGWSSRTILSLSLTGVLLCFLLIWRTRRGQGLISLSLIRSNGFFPALLTLFVFQFVNAGVRFLSPFYLELSCALPVFISSVLLLTYPIAYAPTGIWAGRLSDRIGSRPIVLFALVFCALACGIYAHYISDKNVWIFIIFMLGFGFASGLFSPPNNRMIMSNIPDHQRSEASAFIPVAVNMGSLLGVSVFDTVFSLNFPSETIISLHATGASVNAIQLLNQGFEHTFLLAGLILFAAAIGLMLLVGARGFEPPTPTSRT